MNFNLHTLFAFDHRVITLCYLLIESVAPLRQLYRPADICRLLRFHCKLIIVVALVNYIRILPIVINTIPLGGAQADDELTFSQMSEFGNLYCYF